MSICETEQHKQAYSHFRQSTLNLETEKGIKHTKLGYGKMAVTPVDDRHCIYCSQNAEQLNLKCMFSCHGIYGLK